jgi:hypothetical protein
MDQHTRHIAIWRQPFRRPIAIGTRSLAFHSMRKQFCHCFQPIYRNNSSMNFILTLELIHQHAAIRVGAGDLEPVPYMNCGRPGRKWKTHVQDSGTRHETGRLCRFMNSLACALSCRLPLCCFQQFPINRSQIRDSMLVGQSLLEWGGKRSALHGSIHSSKAHLR